MVVAADLALAQGEKAVFVAELGVRVWVWVWNRLAQDHRLVAAAAWVVCGGETDGGCGGRAEMLGVRTGPSFPAASGKDLVE